MENYAQAKGCNLHPRPTQIEHELKASLQELAHLQNQLADANMKAHELEKGQVATKSTEQAEVIASISQELRQPLSSIVGYTDLLLGESVGILGALQRKFVERIKASTERIHSLTDDMIQITTLEAELNDLKPEAVDLNVVIDNAMSYTSTQVREKNISMHLELPKKLAPIQADREALQQILIHLLQNAGAATPFEGTIRLKVQTRTEEETEFILIQVTDTGGGISADDLPRVFTRLYRADNVLIQGVGDTGVGLSIAKTLTEAHHGRIWVESEQGVGSTFSVLLPIAGDGLPKRSSKLKERNNAVLRGLGNALVVALISIGLMVGALSISLVEFVPQATPTATNSLFLLSRASDRHLTPSVPTLTPTLGLESPTPSITPTFTNTAHSARLHAYLHQAGDKLSSRPGKHWTASRRVIASARMNYAVPIVY